MASGEETGQIKVYAANSQGSNPKLLVSRSTRTLSMGTINPVGVNYTALEHFPPMRTNLAPPSGQVIVTFTADATDIVESEESSFNIPGYLYPVIPGKGLPDWSAGISKNLRTEDIVGFQASAATDITATAAVETRLGVYTVPNGFAWAFGGSKMAVYIGDDA